TSPLHPSHHLTSGKKSFPRIQQMIEQIGLDENEKFTGSVRTEKLISNQILPENNTVPNGLIIIPWWVNFANDDFHWASGNGRPGKVPV
ncbi:hypothetical protein, partial [Blastopirellula marina]